jgi:hypothetical protein
MALTHTSTYYLILFNLACAANFFLSARATYTRLLRAMNVFEACLRADGTHYQHLLKYGRNYKDNYNFSSATHRKLDERQSLLYLSSRGAKWVQ